MYHRLVRVRFLLAYLFFSKRLLDYACFHKGDLKEADRDNSHNNNDGHSLSGSDSQPHGGADTSDFCAFSHKAST